MNWTDNWEEAYYYRKSSPIPDDVSLEKIIDYAKLELETKPSPWVVRIFDNKTGEIVFQGEK